MACWPAACSGSRLLPQTYTLHPHRMERDRSCQLDIMVFSERVSNASVAMLFPVSSAICDARPHVALGFAQQQPQGLADVAGTTSAV